MRRADQVAGLALLALGAAFAAGAGQYPYWGPGGPGSGFLPLWLGLAMAALAVLLLLQTTRRRDPGSRWLPEGAGLRHLLVVLGVTVVFVTVLKITGMALGTVLFLVTILRFIEGHRWPTTLAIAIGVAIVNALVFAYWLRVPFPSGVLGI